MFILNHAVRNIFLLGILLANSAAAYEVLQGPTEVRYCDAALAYNGYTLFGARGGTYLIDMEGRVVRSWSKVRTNPRFLDNGNILDSSTDDPSRGSGFVEVDWDDNVVWRYTETRSDYAPHHDFIRIFNKKLEAYTTLYIANKSITQQQAIAAGCDPSRNYRDAQMDAIVEVDMNGNIVWEWWFFDHVVQDIDPTKANYVGEGKTIADYPGRINLNLPGRPLKRDWLHCNSLDYNPELGYIVTNSVQGEFYVIDHDGTFVAGNSQASISLAASEAGDFLYRFGDPARYEQGDPPSILEDWTKCTSGHKQIGGAHDVQWIDAGLPGAGHFLIFNNGQYMFERTNQSYILEINGFLDANGRDTGDYVNPPDAGYTNVEFHHDTHKPNKLMSNQIVWEYHSKSNQGFFSHIGAGAQRLPNGNTFICSDTEGHFFEVTSEAELVWEYINPMTRQYGAVTVMPDSLPMTNSVFRAYRYGAGHPALVGKELTPGDTITGKDPDYNIPANDKNVSLYLHKPIAYLITLVAIMGLPEQIFNLPERQLIPGGTFDMGDHHDLGGAEHRNDEVPIHRVTLDSFYIGVYEITNQQYCEYLNDALIQGLVNVEAGYVISTQTGDLLCDTYQSDGYSRIHFDSNEFSVAEAMADHPIVGIRWAGAVAYCNWLSSVAGYQACYDPNTGMYDFAKDGFRLPTEAEWEYAGRGGLHDPYAIYPWGDDANNMKANWPHSGDPYEAGPMPYTTPVGFYNGQLHHKSDFYWPGSTGAYLTADGSNGYGLYDMAGNVWEWTNDWYHGDYYSVSPSINPPGPDTGKPMPDGQIYHCLRGGNWYNGPQGHSRVSNRNPAYYRGPQDPCHPWYHIGFRIARSGTAVSGPKPQTVTRPGAQVALVADGFAFAEGPAANAKGEIFFSDLQARKIYHLDAQAQLSVLMENSGGTNGLAFDNAGNLIACQGDTGRMVAIDAKGTVTVLADRYQNKRFNKPNDLWIDPQGGIYFSDPAYGTKVVQDGEHVYYISPNQTRITRVISDMVRPNGLVGTRDGHILYVADHGDSKVYAYDIIDQGMLANKRLFVSKKCDGMTLDRQGNVYITNESSVLVYNPKGELIEHIQAQGQVTNVCFGGPAAGSLYITSTNALYTIDMRVGGFLPVFNESKQHRGGQSRGLISAF